MAPPIPPIFITSGLTISVALDDANLVKSLYLSNPSPAMILTGEFLET